jgi:molecular chaperone GrpE
VTRDPGRFAGPDPAPPAAGAGAGARPDPTDDLTDDELLEAAAGAEEGFSPEASSAVDVAVLVAERDEYRDTLLRVKAEFDNHRKRSAREQGEVRERAAEGLVDKLLVVLDACDAAVGHGAADVEPIAKMLVDVLEREGLERMAAAGAAFDPNLHDAVLHEPGDGGEPVVAEVLRAGYAWKGRVLRPAMVKVRD